MTEEPQLQPLPDGVLDKLRQVSTSTIATQLYKRGFRQPQLLGVRPISQVTDGFVAEAFTMRFIPAREDVNTLDPYRSGNTLQWDAIESVPARARHRGRQSRRHPGRIRRRHADDPRVETRRRRLRHRRGPA